MSASAGRGRGSEKLLHSWREMMWEICLAVEVAMGRDMEADSQHWKAECEALWDSEYRRKALECIGTREAASIQGQLCFGTGFDSCWEGNWRGLFQQFWVVIPIISFHWSLQEKNEAFFLKKKWGFFSGNKLKSICSLLFSDSWSHSEAIAAAGKVSEPSLLHFIIIFHSPSLEMCRFKFINISPT